MEPTEQAAAYDVFRIDCAVALMAPGPRILAQKQVSSYVKAPADGRLQPRFEWRLDLAKLAAGQDPPDIHDRLVLAVIDKYVREAVAQGAAAPGDPNRSQPLSVLYAKLDPAERERQPWRGQTCLQLLPSGRLEAIPDTAL